MARIPLACVTREAIDAMEKRQRVRFVNSLPGFKSLALVGTRSGDGQSNLAMVSTVLHLGSDPPLLGMVSRPAEVPRHTLENIMETGVYTLNHVTESFFEKAHQTSARYPREVSEFEAVGLTESWREGIEALKKAKCRTRLCHLFVDDLDEFEYAEPEAD